jgi:hypothetical protein
VANDLYVSFKCQCGSTTFESRRIEVEGIEIVVHRCTACDEMYVNDDENSKQFVYRALVNLGVIPEGTDGGTDH